MTFSNLFSSSRVEIWLQGARSFVLAGCFGITGCGLQGSNVGLEKGVASNRSQEGSVSSVNIPVTSVQSQGRFGICWAYGTIGLVEAHAKRLAHTDVNLSEEALAFYHMAEYLTEVVHTTHGIELLDFLTRGLNEGFYARIPESRRKKGELDALDLIKKYGVVPESVWNVKFEKQEDRTWLFSNIRSRTLKYMSYHDSQSVTVQSVIDNILVGPGAFPSQPPVRFDYAGQNYDAVAFATQALKFDPDGYSAVETNEEVNLDRVIASIKRSLVRGEAVPFAFPINIKRLHEDTFSGADAQDLNNPSQYNVDGGHLVLVTDFVNVGGAQGALSAPVIRSELLKPASALDFLVFKNSWGVGGKTSATGAPIAFSKDGFYKMNLSYLRGAAHASAGQQTTLIAVVPNDIAQDPFGPEGVNPDVALP